MKILILASSSAEASSEQNYPLCLTEFSGVPLIEKIVLECLTLQNVDVIITAAKRDIQKYNLDSILRLISPTIDLIPIESPTQGATCTSLLAIDRINSDEDLLILNGNELIDLDFSIPIASFNDRGVDAGVLTFSSIHPRYSYVSIDYEGMVEEAAEKKPISRNATVGFYWFKRGKDFVQAALQQIRNDERVEGRFYVCPTLNHLILQGKKVGSYSIPLSQFHPLKDNKQISEFERLQGN